MQKRAATAAHPLSLSLLPTSLTLRKAYVKHLHFTFARFLCFFGLFFTFFHIAGAGSIASRRVASPCLFALRWAFAVSMNMNYGNCRAATTAQQQQSVAHNKDNRNARNTVAITATFFFPEFRVFCLL